MAIEYYISIDLNKNELQTMIQTLTHELGLDLGGVSNDKKVN